MPIRKEKWDILYARMEELGIKNEDLIEKFILGTGKGGQKINKTASTVYLKHLPTSIEIKCGRERSQEMNRYLARQELCEQIAFQIHQEKTKKQQMIEKIRRQKKKRSRRSKEKMLEEKKRHSKTKALRQPPQGNTN